MKPNNKSKPEKETPTSVSTSRAGLVSLSELEPLPSSGEKVCLSDFVKKFSHYLPLCVRMDEGYCAVKERQVDICADCFTHTANSHADREECKITLLMYTHNTLLVTITF